MMRRWSRRHRHDPLVCREFVELVTDYLEGALEPAARRRFDEHLAVCLGCEDYLDQIRAMIATAGRVTPDDLDPVARNRLLATFRDWSGSDPEV